jgi:RNase P/RNase MRP subunit p29
MDFLFHVPFFCTAGGVVAETVRFVNIEFREHKKLILNQVKTFSFRQNNSGLSQSSAQTARINST